MNCFIGMGRLTRDPGVTYAQKDNSVIARFTIAVDRRIKQEGGQSADFIPVVAFGRLGEFAEKYLRQGTKVVVRGRIQTGSYTNREGIKVYTTDLIAEELNFAESKGNSNNADDGSGVPTDEQGFMSIPDSIDEELPFA